MNRYITRYALAALEFGPTIMADLLANISPEKLDQPAGEDRFTPREIIAHLADWEPIFRTRIMSGVENDGAKVVVYDEGVRAIEQGYGLADITESIEKFKASRAETLEMVKGLTEEQVAHSLDHPELGPVAVSAYIWTIIGHDTYHIEQLTKLLEK
jgi:uncharacterized damage-inducible protein DinB